VRSGRRRRVDPGRRAGREGRRGDGGGRGRHGGRAAAGPWPQRSAGASRGRATNRVSLRENSQSARPEILAFTTGWTPKESTKCSWVIAGKAYPQMRPKSRQSKPGS
jgi:hypothetical protein